MAEICSLSKSLYMLPREGPKAAPVKTPAMASMKRAMADPFGPPKGRTYPSSACSGSSVGLPSLSIAQSGGIFSPFFHALRIFPRATMLVAISSTRGSYFPAGMAYERGFVPV